MELLVVVLVVLAVAAVVAAPLRGDRGGAGERGPADVAELEAAKEAKYREIRDAELDFRTGKLSQQDYRALDRSLRAEAVELLRRLDEVRGEQAPVR